MTDLKMNVTVIWSITIMAFFKYLHMSETKSLSVTLNYICFVF